MARTTEVMHAGDATEVEAPEASNSATADEVAHTPLRWREKIPVSRLNPMLLSQLTELAAAYREDDKRSTDAALLGLLRANPNRHALCAELGERLIEHDEIAGGMRYLRLGLEFDSDRPETLSRLEELLSNNDQPGAAAECRRLAAQAGLIRPLIDQAEIELGMRHFDVAIARLKEAVNVARDRGDLRYRLGRALLYAERFEEARFEMEIAVRLLPAGQRHPALFALGRSLYGAGEQVAGLELMPRALEDAAASDPTILQQYAGKAIHRIPALSLRAHCAENDCPTTVVGREEEHIVTQPRYVPAPDVAHEPVRVIFPEPFVAELKDAVVVECQGVVIASGSVLYDGPNLRPDLEQHNVGAYTEFSHGPSDTAIFVPKTETLHLDEAVMLCGRASGNWFHWVFEDLARLLMVEDLAQYRHLPLLVSHRLLETGKRLLERVIGQRRPVIYLDERARVRVDRLITTSDTAILPDGPQVRTEERIVSSRAAASVREAFFAHHAAGRTPVRIFMRRPEVNTRRCCVNERELAELLRQHDFIEVVPEQLPVDEQLELFARAEIVACSMGAALTNLVWAHPNCRLLCFFKGEGRGPYVYNSVARAIGLEPIYARGVVIEGSNPLRNHSDFWMPMEHAREALDLVLSAPTSRGGVTHDWVTTPQDRRQ